MTDDFPANPALKLAEVRQDTALQAGRRHFDHAGASLLSGATVSRMTQHLTLESQVGGYVAQERVGEELEAIYPLLADCFGGQASDYAITGSAVDSWTKLFYSLPIKAGQNIVTAHTEYCANFVAMLHDKAKRGYDIRVANRNVDQTLDLDHLESLIDENTALVCITWVGSSSGEIVPAAKVGEITARNGVPYLLDACQAAGHIPVDFAAVGCDMASGTARKFLRGPRGVGFLYASEKIRKILNPVVMTNQSASWDSTDSITCRTDARLYEAWERSVLSVLGFGVALRQFRDGGIKDLTDQTRGVSDYLRARLAALNSITAGCPEGSRGAIITFNKQGISPAEVKSRLEQQGIAVNVATVFHTRLDLESRNIDSLVRISPNYFTSKEDCDALIDALEAL